MSRVQDIHESTEINTDLIDYGSDREDTEDADESNEADTEMDGNVESESDKVVTNSYSAEEYKAFNEIDRDAEDVLVCSYIKTKDPQTMLKLLNIREQTLRYMAKKYAYLENEDDMYSIFKEVWLKCLKKYDGSKQSRQARDKGGAFFGE